MSTTTILAPRAHTDSATDRDARSEASGGLDRYRSWVTDHSVSAALTLWSVTQVLYLSSPPLASLRASRSVAESVCARGARMVVVDMVSSLNGVCSDY